MKKSHIALFLGGALLVASGAMMAACSSSSDNTGNPSGGGDSGTTGHDGSTTGNDSGGTGNDSGGTGNDGGTADCGSTPTLHPSDAGAIFCAYAPNDGGPLTCATGTQCCIGGKVGSGFAAEDCVTFGNACDNPADGGLPVQCEQTSDCTANGKAGACCMRGSTPQQVAGCGYYKASGGTGVFCAGANACAAGEVQICSSNADCPNGQTCTPMKWKILQLGFCM
jgi:hypothetical protein